MIYSFFLAIHQNNNQEIESKIIQKSYPSNREESKMWERKIKNQFCGYCESCCHLSPEIFPVFILLLLLNSWQRKNLLPNQKKNPSSTNQVKEFVVFNQVYRKILLKIPSNFVNMLNTQFFFLRIIKRIIIIDWNWNSYIHWLVHM